jgi:hypothetical protein
VRSSPCARAAFLLLYGALLAWQIDRWFVTSHGVASTWDHRHDVLTVSAGSPGGISQTFAMGADGLDGLWLRPRTDGRRASGTLIVDVLQVEGKARVRVERVSLPAAGIVPGRNLRVPFRPMQQSGGRVYQVGIRHLQATGGPALEFCATRQDTLPGARLLADGVEQWGDLVLETSARRASLRFWLHEVLRPWPAWVAAWPTVVIALLLFNAALAWACAQAAGLAGGAACPPVHERLTHLPDAALPRRLAALATWLIAAVGVAVTLLPSSTVRTIRLVDHVAEARLQSDRPIHEVVSVEPRVFFSRVYQSLITTPPAALEWTVDVPPAAMFVTGAAEREDLWASASDGFSMRVEIVDDGGTHEIAGFDLFTFGVPAHRNLHRAEVSLQAWAGRRVLLRLVVDPGVADNRVNDVPVWTDPMIRWQSRSHGGVVAGDAR